MIESSTVERLSHYRLDDSRKISSAYDIFDEWIVPMQFGRAIGSTNNLLWLIVVCDSRRTPSDKSLNRTIEYRFGRHKTMFTFDRHMDAMRNLKVKIRHKRQSFEVKSSFRQRLSHSVSQLKFELFVIQLKAGASAKIWWIGMWNTFSKCQWHHLSIKWSWWEHSFYCRISEADIFFSKSRFHWPNPRITINLKQSQLQFYHSNQT